jgi:hypothetical protein
MAHITQMYKWIITHTNIWVMIENIDTQNISLLENPLCISPSSHWTSFAWFYYSHPLLFLFGACICKWTKKNM